MNPFNYIGLVKRNISYYKTSYLSVLTGIIISFIVLTGSLTVGDSVRFSLNKIAQNRIGKIDFAIIKNSGFFTDSLLKNYSSQIKKTSILKLDAFAVKDGGRIRKNQISVLGVHKKFFDFAPEGKKTEFSCSGNEAIVNQKLAREMNLKIGDTLLVRLYKKGFILDELSLTDAKTKHIALRIKIKHIAGSNAFGKFGLNSDQQAPLNIFLSYQYLARKTDLSGVANLILISDEKENHLTLARANEMVKESLTPEDAQILVNKITGSDTIEITSKSVFIKQAISSALLKEFQNTDTIFTYFVNSIDHKTHRTPYSFVAGTKKMTELYGLGKNEIIVNKWLAHDLNLKKGSTIKLTYFIFDRFRRLTEASANFLVKSIIETNNDPSLKQMAPDIPGLSDSRDCRSWKSGIPIDLSKIRQKDEHYWDLYKGTPKAFIHIDRAQELWKNRSGDLTSIRVHHKNAKVHDITQKTKTILTPQMAGIDIRDIKKEAAAAVKHSQDFGLLFISLGFFLILSSFILTILFLKLLLKKRVSELGTLKTLGFSSNNIYKIFMLEGSVICVVGGVIGTLAGIFFNYAIITLLGSMWQGSVGKTQIFFYFSTTTLIYGLIAGILISLITLFILLKRTLKPEIASLHSDMAYRLPRPKSLLLIKILTAIFITVLISITVYAYNIGQTSQVFQMLFFLAGFITLITAGLLFYLFLCFMEKPLLKGTPSILKTALKNCTRSKTSSLSVFITLSCGLFVIISVSAYRMSPLSDTGKRDTGTGGFSHIIETSIPVQSDLNSIEGKKQYGLTTPQLKDLRFVQLKATKGSDASCLNLNRAQNPVIVGIDTDKLSSLAAFKFVNNSYELTRSSDIWKALDNKMNHLVNNRSDKGIIPAAADLNTIMWGLGKKPGEIISVRDEAGNKFDLKLSASLGNSILQGKLIISLNHFEKIFPQISGSRYILVDGQENNDLTKELTYALRDTGADVISASKRLFEFSTVQNTYLSIFLVIGGLGLVIGIFGLATIMFKNIDDRKKELAILRAFGFSRKKIKSLLLIEFGFLFIAGIITGVIAAIHAVIPSILSSGYEAPFHSILLFIIVIALTGFFSILIIVHQALGRSTMADLTSE